MTLKDKIILYVYNKGNELENEKDELKAQRRYQIMDSLDIYENMLAEIRVNAFNEFVQDLFKIIMYCDTKPHKSQNKPK